MPNTRTILRSFAGGEVSPEMFGRLEDTRFLSGLARCTNMVVKPYGPVQRRPGFAFVKATKNNGAARLIPFTYSTDQTMVVELGAGYARFHTAGATLLHATPKVVASTDAETNQITFTAAHGLINNDPIVWSSVGGALPSGLTKYTTYYTFVVSATVILVSATSGPGVAVDIGALTAGVTMYGFKQSANFGPASAGSAPRQYVPPTNFTTNYLSDINALLNTTHLFKVGDPIVFVASPAALPTGLTANTVYYVVAAIAGSHIYVSATLGGAPIDLLANGTARGYYYYTTNVGGTLVTYPGSGFYYLNAPNLRIVTLTIASPGVVTLVGHGFINGDRIHLLTTGALPTGLVAAAQYFIVNKTDNTFQLSATYAGAAINTTGSQSGTHRVYLNEVREGAPGAAGFWHLMPDDGTYEIPTPYLAADLFDVGYSQSFDIMTLTHEDYDIRELRRRGAAQWTLDVMTTAPEIGTPGGVGITETFGDVVAMDHVMSTAGYIRTIGGTGVAHGFLQDDVVAITGLSSKGISDGTYVVADPNGPSGQINEFLMRHADTGAIRTTTGTGAVDGTARRIPLNSDISNSYKVTAIAASGIESTPSLPVSSTTNNLYARGAYNTIDWDEVAGASLYRVYKKQTGLYGFIGEVEDDGSASFTFKDDNIAPDLGITMPLLDQDLDAGSGHAAATVHFEQRRGFGGKRDALQSIWMSRSGTETDFTYHIPVIDTDRIAFQVASREGSTVRHLVPLDQLLVFTNSTEYRVTPVDTDALTPSSAAVRPQSYIGSSRVRPLVVNRTVLFCAERGGHVRETGYNQDAGGYLTGDLSARAAHLFDDDVMVDSALMKAPLPIAWFVNDAGLLLGLTYVPEEQVGAWHWHDTDGTFESCCVVAEGVEDRLYVVVQRTINSATVRHVERMGVLAVGAQQDGFFVDAGSTYDGTAVTTISGATHLAGEAVAVLADGLVVTGKTVSAAGVLTLTTAASVVQFGLPYTSEIQTLPFAQQFDAASGQGRQFNVNKAFVRVYESGRFELGPTTSDLKSSDPRLDWGTTLKSEQIEVVPIGTWQYDGQVFVRQASPLPLTVTALVFEVAIGGA